MNCYEQGIQKSVTICQSILSVHLSVLVISSVDFVMDIHALNLTMTHSII